MRSVARKLALASMTTLVCLTAETLAAEEFLVGRSYYVDRINCYITNISTTETVSVRDFSIFSRGGRIKPSDLDFTDAKNCPKSGTFELRPLESCILGHIATAEKFLGCRVYVSDAQLVRAHGAVSGGMTAVTYDLR